MNKIFFGAILAGFLFFGCDEKEKNAFASPDLPPLKCDLDIEKCSALNHPEIYFEISPYHVKAMKPHSIKISGNLPNFNAPSIVISGENMFMGLVKSKLQSDKNGLVGEFMVAACTMSVMRFKAEIYDGDTATGIIAYFDLKREK